MEQKKYYLTKQVPYEESICGYAIFHTRKEAKFRQRQMMKSIETKIVKCEITYTLPAKPKKK